MTADLVVFLRARLGEIEARENSRWTMGEWHGQPCPVCLAMFDPNKPRTYVQRVESIEFGTTRGHQGYTLHPCRHELSDAEFRQWSGAQPAGDPYTLADVAAKRRIIEAAEIAERHTEKVRRTAADYRFVREAEEARDALRHVVRLLVLPFAGHEDYQACWMPEGEDTHG